MNMSTNMKMKTLKISHPFQSLSQLVTVCEELKSQLMSPAQR